MATQSSQYQPRTAPVFSSKDMQQLVSYIVRELNQISDVFTGVQVIMLQEQHVPPTNFMTGMVVLADGTNWNPGSGKGFYGYADGVWHFLG